jgi:hypothetical protein
MCAPTSAEADVGAERASLLDEVDELKIDRDDPLLTRPWSLVAEAKTRRWLARKSAGGAAEGIRIGCLLRAHVRAVRPNWPSEADRAEDLAHHQRLSRLLNDVELGGR